MTDRTELKLKKWPFIAADIVICGAAAYVLQRTLPAQGPWQVLLAMAALGAAGWGAWLWIMPFLEEFKAQEQQAQNSDLGQAMKQIDYLRTVGADIKHATGAWQQAQEQANTTVKAARDIAQRMESEAKEFQEFLRKAQDQEKTTLRLEVDKLRRGEGEWLQLTIRLLDHTFALHAAAVRSGQQNLIGQLGQFQMACRDAARRMGIVPYSSDRGEVFDERAHHWDKEGTAPPQSKIEETLAPGYTFQGQLVRKALVSIQTESPAPADSIEHIEHGGT